MRTTKQKIISAITLFLTMMTAQSVFAYYNPSTGCWLSRDPIGEPGFQLVQQANQAALVRNVAGPPLPPRKWIARSPLSGKRDGNLYGFVYNNPLSLYDPLGLKVQICCRDINVNPTANCLAKISPAQRSVRAGARKAISYQYTDCINKIKDQISAEDIKITYYRGECNKRNK